MNAADRGAEILDDAILRHAPHNTDAEMAVIGGLLGWPDAYDRIDWLASDDFYNAKLRLVYHAIRSMLEAGEAVDVLLVADRLRERGAL